MTPPRYLPIPGLELPCRIALLADSHVPDRVAKLPESLLGSLRSMKPDLIFHAGDISVHSVLETLSSIAPVIASAGNRDFTIKPALKVIHRMDLGSLKIVLTHGHGSLLRYMRDKLKYIRTGYNFDRYRGYFDTDFPEADLILFGHTHTPEEFELGGRTYLNPGATYPCASNEFKPRYILLELSPGGRHIHQTIFI